MSQPGASANAPMSASTAIAFRANVVQGSWQPHPSLGALLGYDDGLLPPGFDLLAALPEGQPALLKAALEKLLQPGGPPLVAHPLYCRHKLGYMVPLLLMAHAGPAHEPGTVQGLIIDLNLPLAQQTRLKQENEQLDLILKGINAGVFDGDMVTGQEVWSDRYYRILSYEPGQVQPHNNFFVNELVHPDDRALVLDAAMAHIENGTPYSVEVRVKTKDGSYRWMQATGRVTCADDGTPLRFSGAVIDIDERRRNQDSLRHSRFILDEAGKMGGVGGWTFNLETGKISWTEETYNIHGVEQGRPVNLDLVISFYEPDDAARLQTYIDRAIKRGVGWQHEAELRRPDGSRLWTQSMGKPLFGNDGRVTMLAGAVQDISAQKRRELELKNSVALVKDQNKRLQNFAHIVSHNLRSHASNLHMLATMTKNARNPAEQQEMAEMLHKTSGTLADTLNHLTEIVRIQSAVNQVRTSVAFAPVLEAVRQQLHPLILRSNARIEVDFEQLPAIDYVPEYMDSILFNLVSNALRYRHPQRWPVLRISTGLKNGKPWLTVADNGLGLDLKRHGQKLFGMYKTFHKHPEARGMGLFLVKNQVEALGGRIAVESEPDVGSRFTVWF